ncbi:MAG: ATP-dependent RNA helicase DbpA, partial [Chromatiales bacterium]|nr:ATP-dependent RNA helicase DbpA [Chromatiales bacterium]
RIGRTGRAGSTGIACSLYDDGEGHKVALLDGAVDPFLDAEPLPTAAQPNTNPIKPLMATLRIDGGKKQKLRPGDVLGGLTGEQGIAGNQVGKINVFDNWTFVAVSRDVVKPAMRKLGEGKLKGRRFRVRRV